MNKLSIKGNEVLTKDEHLFAEELKKIVQVNLKRVYSAINYGQVYTNWCIGRRIVEQEQKGENRAEYGKRVAVIASEINDSLMNSTIFFIRLLRLFFLFKLLEGIGSVPQGSTVPIPNVFDGVANPSMYKNKKWFKTTSIFYSYVFYNPLQHHQTYQVRFQVSHSFYQLCSL